MPDCVVQWLGPQPSTASCPSVTSSGPWRRAAIRPRWAADVMADEPVYVDVDDPIASVAERMLDEGVRHVPVVSDGRVLGVVSVRNALRVLADAWRSPEGETRHRRRDE